MKKTLVIVALLLVSGTAHAGTLYPTYQPSHGAYSLDDLYQLVTASTVRSVNSGSINVPASVTSTQYSIDAIYAALLDRLDLDDDENLIDIGSGTVVISESSSIPNTSILVVDTNDKKGPYDVLSFNVSNNNEARVLLERLVLVARSDDDLITDVISTVIVEIKGEEFEFDSVTAPDGQIGEYLFDFESNNNEINLARNESIEVVVRVEFNQTST